MYHEMGMTFWLQKAEAVLESRREARQRQPLPGTGTLGKLRHRHPGENDEQIVVNAQDHATNKHALTVTREEMLALAASEKSRRRSSATAY
jgi:hypothetical protein